MHEQLGQIMTTRYKKTKIQLPLLRCQERKHDATHDSCTGHHQGRGQTTWASSPVQSTHLPLHSLTPCKKPGHTPWRVSKCTCFLFSSPRAAAQVPLKPCLDVSSDLLSVSTEERAQGLRWVIRCNTVAGELRQSGVHCWESGQIEWSGCPPESTSSTEEQQTGCIHG